MPNWNQFNQSFIRYPDLGFSLDFSLAPLPDTFLQSLGGQIAAAEAAMRQLEAGGIANPDEGRMVGHYWLRNSALAPAELQAEIDSALAATLQFAADVHAGKIAPQQGGKFTRVLVVGIGGSALGPQLVAEAITPVNPPLAISFFDNTDPDGISRVMAVIGAELATTLTLVISKS